MDCKIHSCVTRQKLNATVPKYMFWPFKKMTFDVSVAGTACDTIPQGVN